jgi:hypothetical protein
MSLSTVSRGEDINVVRTVKNADLYLNKIVFAFLSIEASNDPRRLETRLQNSYVFIPLSRQLSCIFIAKQRKPISLLHLDVVKFVCYHRRRSTSRCKNHAMPVEKTKESGNSNMYHSIVLFHQCIHGIAFFRRVIIPILGILKLNLENALVQMSLVH